MVFIGAVEPATEDALGHRVEEGVLQLLVHDFCVVFGQDDEGSLAEVFVSDGDFACNDVGQGVDEGSRTGIEVFRVLDGGLVGCVGLQRGAAVKEHHRSVFARHKTRFTFGLQKQFRGHEAQFAQGVHLEELQVVADVGAVEFRQ